MTSGAYIKTRRIVARLRPEDVDQRFLSAPLEVIEGGEAEATSQDAMLLALQFDLDVRPWPALLDEREALEYSGLGETVLRRLQRERKIVFRTIGPNGKKVCQRSQLDVALAALFDPAGGLSEDFEFEDDDD